MQAVHTAVVSLEFYYRYCSHYALSYMWTRWCVFVCFSNVAMHALSARPARRAMNSAMTRRSGKRQDLRL